MTKRHTCGTDKEESHQSTTLLEALTRPASCEQVIREGHTVSGVHTS